MNKFKTILSVLLISTLCLAQGSLPWPKGGTTVYVVKPGDTLWDITDRFFGNPFLWPRLWAINPYIDNPHVILPGDQLKLTDLPVVKLNPETEYKQLEKIDPPPPVFYYSPAGGEGFISPGEWEHSGTILSSDPPKILLGEGDMVYTNVGSDQGITKGDRFTVFKASKVVDHPINGSKVGHKVAVLGEIEITEILGKNKSAARITSSYREITRGSRIRPRGPVVKEVILKKGHKNVQGFILTNLKNLELMGQGDIVYIDVGREDSVTPGHTFTIFTLPRKTEDPDRKDEITIPGVKIGKLVVLNVQAETSTGLIVESRRQIIPGNIVVLDTGKL